MAEQFEYTREWTDAKAFPLLGFTRSWENPDDYPTIEMDETKVRQDMQSLHDEVKDYINTKLIPAVLAEDATEEARASAEAARAEAEDLRDQAEKARAIAEGDRVTAEGLRDQAEKARAIAEGDRVTAEGLRDQAEKERVEADIQRTENSEQVIRDSAQYAYLSKAYASGQGSRSERFKNIPAGRGYFSVNYDDNTCPYVEVGRTYKVTVNGETVETVATFNGISALGVTITEVYGGGYQVKNNNDYDVVSGSYETVDASVYGKDSKTYSEEAKLAANEAEVFTNGGEFVADQSVHSTDGAKNYAEKAKAFADGGSYLRYGGNGLYFGETVEKGAKQYAEEAASSSSAAAASADAAAASAKLAKPPKCVTITLSASGWDSTAKTQTVTVTGVSATETAQLITPVPALASQAAYYDAGIKCTGQAANSLTFTADTVPTVNLTVYVTIQEVSA